MYFIYKIVMQQNIITDKGERGELVSDFYDKLGRRVGQLLILDGQGGGGAGLLKFMMTPHVNSPLSLHLYFYFSHYK